MFWIGLAMIIMTSATFLFVEKDLGISPMIFGLMGIVFIGALNYRPMK